MFECIRALALLFIAISVLSACGGSSPAPVDPTSPNQAPTADAGADEVVDEGTAVSLSGAGTDSDGTIVSYSWQQTGGTGVTIADANMASASFTAPLVTAIEDLIFSLTVMDNDGAAASDTVTVTVNDVPSPPSGSIELISRSSQGDIGLLGSTGAIAGTQGRQIVFQSEAPNFVPNDSNGISDVFVRDRVTGLIERISVDSNGNEALPNPNGSGFANLMSTRSMSADGRYVLFSSFAPNLVQGDNNAEEDLFIRDRQQGTTTRVSLMSGQIETDRIVSGTMTPDGRYVAFARNFSSSLTGTWSKAYWRDVEADITIDVIPTIDGQDPNSFIFNLILDGPDQLIFTSIASNLVPNDTNNEADGFVARIDVANRTVLEIKRLTLVGNGFELNGRSDILSGRLDCFAFFSDATNTGTDFNLGTQKQLYIRHTLTGQPVIERVSRGPNGELANDNVSWAVVSRDCSRVVYHTRASNLVSGDTNGRTDVFAAEAPAWTAIRLSLREDGTQPIDSGLGSVAVDLTDLEYVVFQSNSALILEDVNGQSDIYGRPFP